MSQFSNQTGNLLSSYYIIRHAYYFTFILSQYFISLTSFLVSIENFEILKMGCGSSNQSYTSSQDDRSIEDYDTPENDFEEVTANLNNEERHYIPLPGVILNMTPDVVANVPSKRDNDDEYDNPPHHSRPSKSQTHNHRRRKSSSRRPRRSDQSYNHLTYVALFDYKARLNADMSFRKGDLLEIVDDKDGEDWRMAKLFSSGDMGLVPSVYIALNGSLDSKE